MHRWGFENARLDWRATLAKQEVVRAPGDEDAAPEGSRPDQGGSAGWCRRGAAHNALGWRGCSWQGVGGLAANNPPRSWCRGYVGQFQRHHVNVQEPNSGPRFPSGLSEAAGGFPAAVAVAEATAGSGSKIEKSSRRVGGLLSSRVYQTELMPRLEGLTF
jgi:hypothetical protein